jgi:beta-lactamase regulating signal transducer with metallopeptidase domain/protein involved in polysaccharide export with SLBB domain
MNATSMLNHLWQSTLFAVAAGLLTLALRKNRAPVRYWLWLAASVKFLVPFSLLVTIGHQFDSSSAPEVASIQLSAAPLSSMIHEIGKPFAPPVQAQGYGRAALAGLWLCGVLAVAFAWLRQWLRARSALRSASPLDLGLSIPTMSSPAGMEPGVLGVFRPVLLVPEGITDRLAPAQWQAILAHELCHVRRRDNLTAAIHMTVEMLFWFHPLVWWIGKRLMDERERACDEAVLLDAADPAAYAEGILNVCKFYLQSPLRCVSGVTGSNLKKRIRAIMTQRVAGDLNLAKKLVLAAAGLAALVTPITVGVMNAPIIFAQAPAQSPPELAPPVASTPVKQSPAPRIAAQTIVAQNQPKPAPGPAPVAPKPLPGLIDPSVTGGPADLSTYVIGANDVLNIEVLENPVYTKLYPVRSDGMLTIPLFGEVKAEGLTPLQLKKQLVETLSQKLKDPEVSVTVWQVRSKKYTVAGQVKRPGSFPLIRSTTVFEALNDAGGFLDSFSNQRDILILRADQTFHFDYRAYIEGENRDRNIALQNGDTVIVK